MQLEWSRFLEGMSAFKEGQGMLWIICIVFFVIIWRKGALKKQGLFVGSLVLGVCVVCPVTAVILLKVFTPFYNWLDLQQLFPVILPAALFGTELYFFLKKRDIPGIKSGAKGKAVISGMCVAIILLTATVFHGFDREADAGENGVPVETAEILEALHEVTGDAELVVAAPGDMLQYVRLFKADWHPVYGRDLWSAKSASYINSGYDMEYRYYSLLGKAELSTEEYEELTALVNDSQADCVIIPGFWLENMGEMPDYEAEVLTDSYTGIIKKDLLTK